MRSFMKLIACGLCLLAAASAFTYPRTVLSELYTNYC
jgi:hypothetical protein